MVLPVCVVLLCLLHTSQAADPPDIREPPSVQKPLQVPDMYYKSAGSFILPCNATGIPNPTYTWALNNKPVDPNQRNVVHLTAGSIEIRDASALDEGEYQCVAANKYGKSISQVFDLQRAKLGGFPADKIVKDFRGVKGQSLKVTRVNINCAPNPSFNWKIVNNVDDESPRELTKTRRVTQDLDGNLYFTALTMQDALGGLEFYKVDVFNNVLDTTAGGSYSRVIVDDGPDVDQPSKLMYPEKSEINVIVLEGEELKLQCIFGGSPSAEIHWSGPARGPEILEYDTIYIVRKASRAHEGTYTCIGRNSAGTDRATIHVDVQSIPKFTLDGKPGKRTLSEDDNVEFTCQTTDDTEPPATITWMVNVDPIDEDLPGKRTEVHKIKNGKVLSIIGLKRADIKVIQCKVSNIHKTLYADAPLNVLLRTQLVVRPQDKMVMENDTKVTFFCDATSDPSTKVTLNWTRDGKPIQFYDDPHIVKGEGMLTIYFNESTVEERARYAGHYGCNASNTYSYSTHEVELDFINRPDDPDKIVAAESSLWLIILIIVLILLLLIFFLVCCICCNRNKGGSYPVDEKERATGNDPIADLDKSGFHDYIRPPITKRKDSRASLTSTVFMGSTSSLPMMGDYSEGGMSEDGSFIGMYMDDRRKLKPSYSEA